MINPKLIKLKSFNDQRGFFISLLDKKLSAQLNLKGDISKYQISVSKSSKNVIRGLHYQTPKQSKLVYVMAGRVQDIVVNINKKSKNFGKCYEFILKDNEKILYIPKDYAHGFCALEESKLLYILDNNYNSIKEKTIAWNDIDLNIKWMTSRPSLSKKDHNGLPFKNL